MRSFEDVVDDELGREQRCCDAVEESGRDEGCDEGTEGGAAGIEEGSGVGVASVTAGGAARSNMSSGPPAPVMYNM